MTEGKKRQLLERTLVIIISLFISIVLWMNLLDTTPATLEDYAGLKKLATEIESNPDLLFKEERLIEVQKDGIVLTFENEECKIIATYNQEIKLINCLEVDKCSTLLTMIMAIMVSTIAVSSLFGGIILGVLSLLSKNVFLY